jgi:histidinol dehydrogenase
LVDALELAAKHIMRFSLKQKEQFADFEYEMETGLITGQRVIPVERVAVYIPGGRFPLFSSVLMCVIPAFCAGVQEVILSSPPTQDGLPDRKTLAAAAIAAEVAGIAHNGSLRLFAIGGAQAIAALALGTESVPRVDVIAGPGNKFVAAAKRVLFGEVGIDFIAGPTDVLVISDGSSVNAADLAAADMIGQAEHDPDARARSLVPNMELANQIAAAIEKRLTKLPTEKTARASLDAGGLIIVYQNKEEAIRIANVIAPEHLELQIDDAENWIPLLKNYGSLFIGSLSAEALGDYSAGVNHTLPTSTSARFTGGLSVRHFLKTVTTLRCVPGAGFENSRNAAEIIARAEGLEGHAQSAAVRK